MNVKKSFLYERLMILFAAIVQSVGFVISITVESYSNSFLPYCRIVVPIANISCAAICFFLVAFPKFRFMQSVVSFIQGIVMTLNNLMFLGIFLYFFGIALLFCYGYLNTKRQVRYVLSILPLMLSFFIILPKSLPKFFMAFSYSLFLTFAFLHLYFTVKNSLLDLFPFLSDKISTAKLPKHGETLNLKNYELSERQIEITKEFLKGTTNYKKLAECFVISESTVKKEMSNVCKKFGVDNSTVLLLLLKQYEII